MKKVLLLIFTALIMVTVAGCSTEGLVTTVSTVTPEYENDKLKELTSYLVENNLIKPEAVVIEASYINAEEGYRYTSSDMGNIEIYYFKDKLSDYYKQAKEGTIKIYASEYKTVLTSDGEFVLVYSKDIDSTNITEKKINLIDAFKAFPEKITSDSDK